MKPVYCALFILMLSMPVYAGKVYTQFEVKCSEDFMLCKTLGGELLNGEIHYSAGSKVLKVIPYQNGKIHGAYLNYYTDTGELAQEAEFKNGVADGYFRQYYPNGTLSMESPHKKGVIHGVVKLYSKSGKFVMSVEVNKGKATGGKCNGVPLTKEEIADLNGSSGVECEGIAFSLK